LDYSVLKLFTGLSLTAFKACKLIVSKAIPNAPIPAIKNIHQEMEMRKAKSWSHLYITNQPIGIASNSATTINCKKSFDKSRSILWAEDDSWLPHQLF
jgi:hypothetical protein